MAGKFALKDGRWTKGKDPAADVFYDIDFSAYLAGAGTTLSTVLSTIVQGVTVTVPAVIDGAKVVVKLSGLDVTAGALNFCRFRLRCSNTETFEATMWFERSED